MKRGVIALCGALALPLLSGCAGNKVQRLDTGSVTDLSGKWNDTDSRLVAEEMISDCTSRPWLENAQTDLGKTPTVIVGTIRNQSMEHINTDTFIEDLQRALINSGKVQFVASKAERGAVRGERLDQDTNASDDSRKANGQETGADFMLSGVINAIEDHEGGQTVMYYQTNLKLLNIKTNQIAWDGEKKIKKFIQQARASW